jgi:Secretion system C-terminal sorting domain
MKNYLLIISVILSIYNGLNAQSNLVLNPGLESYYDTSGLGFASFRDGYVTNWSDPNGGSSDFYVPNGIGVTPPNNLFGFEFPHNGYCYGGLIFYQNPSSWYESIQASFSSSLLAGKTYAIESFVSLADHSICFSDLGFYFSDTMITEVAGAIIPVTAQYENPVSNLINTHEGWQRITGTYTAHGGENFMSIGIFKPYSAMNLDTCAALGGSFDYDHYVFIDDVAVYDTAKVDTIHLCMNDSVQLGGIWRRNAGLYTDMVGGLPVKFYIEPRPYSANLTIIDKPFLPGDSVRISLVQKGSVDSTISMINFLWASQDTNIDIPMYNIYGCDSTVRYRCGTNLSIGNELNNQMIWGIYPNPANDFIQVKLSSNDPAKYAVMIIDVAGREVLSHSLTNDKIDISALKSGMYFIKLINTKTVNVIGTEKFVKE